LIIIIIIIIIISNKETSIILDSLVNKRQINFTKIVDLFRKYPI